MTLRHRLRRILRCPCHLCEVHRPLTAEEVAAFNTAYAEGRVPTVHLAPRPPGGIHKGRRPDCQECTPDIEEDAQ